MVVRGRESFARRDLNSEAGRVTACTPGAALLPIRLYLLCVCALHLLKAQALQFIGFI
jgi:hypothetical protein